jgi:hypothetical protein
MICAYNLGMKSPQTTEETQETCYLCEYAEHPLEECYCRRLNGRTVPTIVMYCMDRYRECPIYRSRAARS